MVRRLSPFSPVHQISVLLCYGITHAAPAEHCNTRATRWAGAFDHGKPLNLQPDQGASAPPQLSRMAGAPGATSKGEGIGDRSGHSVSSSFLGSAKQVVDLLALLRSSSMQYQMPIRDARQRPSENEHVGEQQGQARPAGRVSEHRRGYPPSSTALGRELHGV